MPAMRLISLRSLLGLTILQAFVFTDARAVDGVIEINQSAAIEGGVTPGDAPGFPVLLSESGSYRLTGNLVANASGQNAITVGADFVTIDLGGFALLGGGTGRDGVGRSSSAIGRTVVRNGFIDLFSNACVSLGDDSTLEDITVTNCEDTGVLLGDRSVARRVTVTNSGGAGVLGGMTLGTDSAYDGLVLAGNVPTNLTGGKSIGASVCDGKPCSGPTLRRYYLTSTIHDGASPTTACAAGFHFASLFELSDPSGLSYASDLGLLTADTGEGPPSAFAGWARTGSIPSVMDQPGIANCMAWVSSSVSSFGSTARLEPFWDGAGIVASPWAVTSIECSSPVRVWCVEDAP